MIHNPDLIPMAPPMLDAKKQKAIDKETGTKTDQLFGYDYIKRFHVTAPQLARSGIGLSDLRRVAGMKTWTDLASLQFTPQLLFARRDIFPIRNMIQDFGATWEGLHFDMGLTFEHLLTVDELTPRDLQAMQFSARYLQEWIGVAENRRDYFKRLTQHANISALEWKNMLGLTWDVVLGMRMHENESLRKAFRK